MEDSLTRLRAIQDEHDAVYREYEAEQRALEARFRGRFRPLFASRGAEIAKGHVDRFWLSALNHHDALSEKVTEKDAEVLAYLMDVRDVNAHEKAADAGGDVTGSVGGAGGGNGGDAATGAASGDNGESTPNGGANNDDQDEQAEDDARVGMNSFTLEFHFAPNPFFTNAVLFKKYIIDEEDELVGMEGCTINWKPGKNVMVKEVRRKNRGGGGRGRGGRGRGGGGGGGAPPRTVVRTEPVDSFFNFFVPPPPPPEEDAHEDEGGAMEEYEEYLEADFELGDLIRTELIPRALHWYTGEDAADDEEDERGHGRHRPGGMVGELDDEDDDDDDDDDDDSDDDGGAGGASGGNRGGNAAAQEECKQQ